MDKSNHAEDVVFNIYLDVPSQEVSWNKAIHLVL